MIRIQLIRSVILSLLAAIIFPISLASPAHAADIIKTITVNGSNGAPLAGASVLIIGGYADGTASLVRSTTSNASGVATLTLPDTTDYLRLAVEPAIGDLTNAIMAQSDLSIDLTTGTSQAITVSLRQANMRVQIKNESGADVEKGMAFFHPSTANNSKDMAITARTGSFGIALAQNLTPGTGYHLAPYPLKADLYLDQSLFSRDYGLKVLGSENAQSYSVFTSLSYTTPLDPVGGVYTFTMRSGNIAGQLVNSGGTNLALPTGVTGSVEVRKLTIDGNIDYSDAVTSAGAFSWHEINPDGSFPLRIDGQIAGRYGVKVNIFGSQTFPSFTSIFWQDSEGKFSRDGITFTAAPFALNLTVPTANFKGKVVLPGTSTLDTTTIIDINNHDNGQQVNWLRAPTGEFATSLRNGIYDLRVSTGFGSGLTNRYVATIEGNVLTSLVLGAVSQSDVDGVFTLTTPLANLKVSLTDSVSSLALTEFNFDVLKDLCSGCGKLGNIADGSAQLRSGVYSAQAYVAPGTYILRLRGTVGYYGTKDFALTISDAGVASIAGQVAVGGLFNLSIAPANFRFTLAGDFTDPNFSRPNYQRCTGPNEFQRNICVNAWTNETGMGADSLATGTYYIVFGSNSPTSASRVYTLAVSSDGVITLNKGATKDSDGRWLLSGATPNIKFKIYNPVSNTLSSDGYISIDKVNSDGEYLGYLPEAFMDPSNVGLAQAYVPDGTYNLMVNPNGSPEMASRSYALTVEGGVPVLTSSGVEVSKDGDRWVVAFAQANLLVQLFQPDGSTPLTQSWFEVCVDSGDGPNRFTNCFGRGVDQDSKGAVHVEAGSYYLHVNPGNASVSARKSYKLTVANDGTATVKNLDNSAVTKAGDYWPLTSLTANLSGSFENPEGAPLEFLDNQGLDLQLQKWNEVKNFWEYKSGQWRSANSFAFNITEAGKYKILANPYGFPAYVQTSSDPFYVDVNGKFSTSVGGSLSDSLTALTIKLNTPNILLDITDPRSNSLIRSGWINVFSLDPVTNRQDWVTNANITSTNPGKTGLNLGDGTYRIELNPQIGSSTIAGLARKQYKVVVSGSGTSVVITGWSNTTPVLKNAARFILPAGTANITGQVVSSGNLALAAVAGSWININVQKLNAKAGWDWTENWVQPDSDGYFNVSVEDPGTYRLRIEPQGRQDATVTFSDQFILTSANAGTFEKKFTKLSLNAPDLTLSVYQGVSPTALANIGIEIRKNDQWFDWVNTGNNGIAAISFAEAGLYQLTLNPNMQQIQQGFTKKSYDVTVTKDSTSGIKTVSVNTNAGASAEGNLTKLKLGDAALSGVLRYSALMETATVENGTVVAINIATGQEMWQYSSNTSSTGRWAMSLPAGTYKLQARSPWGYATYGNGDQLGVVTINSAGVAALTGDLDTLNPLNLVLSLKDPTWTGTVKSPDATTNIANAQVCLVLTNNWNCVQANQLGQWAMSAPTGFLAFDASAQLRIEDVQSRRYPSLIITGAAQVSTALGGTAHTGLVHSLPNPNVSITVKAGIANAAGIWVNLEEVNGPWLGGNSSDVNGVARFYIDPTKLSVDLRIRAEINGNPTYSTDFAPAIKVINGNSDSITAVIDLDVPNFRANLAEPTVGEVAGAFVPYAWVELFKDSGNGQTGDWLGGTNTDSQGKFSLFAPAAQTGTENYIVRVNSPWNSASTSSSREYRVTTNTSGEVTATVIRSNLGAVTTTPVGDKSYWNLTLAAPSVMGTVFDKDGHAIANSWISPFNITDNSWISGVNSRNSGAFAMALPDGQYRLEANVPWGVSDTSKSAQCTVTIFGGAVSNSGACINDEKKVTLSLRTPNITFTLKSGTDVMANAHVGMAYGNWSTNAQADGTGKVSLYLDVDAIALANPGLTGAFAPYVWVDPPWNSNDKMVRWDCQFGASKPICSSLIPATVGTPYPLTNVPDDIQVSKPNTRIKVVTPAGANIGQGAWINLVGFDTATAANQVWAGAVTDSSGYAYFNVETTTARVWGVTINPPWEKKTLYSTKDYGTYAENNNWTSGLTWDEIVSTDFAPATPNFSITVKLPGGTTPNRYAWVQLEEIDSSGNTISWKNGASLDYSGQGALLLGASKSYRITAYPNGSVGTRTTCYIDTNVAAETFTVAALGGCAAGTQSGAGNKDLALTLDIGNVTGTITHSSGLISGAIILAQVGSDTSTTTTTTSGANGRFGLQLDSSKTWTITVVPPGTTMANQELTLAPGGFTSSAAELGLITLVNRTL